MTTQNMIEVIQIIFPKLTDNMVINYINIAIKDFLANTGGVQKIGVLTNPSGSKVWEIPKSATKIKSINYYDSNSLPLYKEDMPYALEHRVEKELLIFFDSSSEENTSGVPSNVHIITIDYEAIPNNISGIADVIDVEEQYHSHILAKVFSDLYMLFQVETVWNGQKTVMKDLNSARQYNEEYLKGITLKKRNSGTRDSTDWDIVLYDSAASVTLPKHSQLLSGLDWEDDYIVHWNKLH
jgi:hypothetical protein